MATAAATTVAQVSEIVPLGSLDPETVITPGIFVQHVVRVSSFPASRTDESEKRSQR
jgi:3-oxoadipate CoA-transferase alpha subunit